MKKELSIRLSTVANLIKRDSVVADIGCDHAFLSIYLIESGIA
ncbi:MAG: tRNA (adenine(22)-N(1))-methyltransferase TrmK, partial [Clostridia bacterium]|nr:tRNA (adenine(22)-N(1))-methyltransferase TrmK [Clostridia bacterium]